MSSHEIAEADANMAELARLRAELAQAEAEAERDMARVHDALDAGRQCIEDFLDAYTRGCSMQILDLAVRDLKVDALARINAALRGVS